MTGANIDRSQELQITIVITEFSTFKLYSLQNFVVNGKPHSPFPVPCCPFPVPLFKDSPLKIVYVHHFEENQKRNKGSSPCGVKPIKKNDQKYFLSFPSPDKGLKDIDSKQTLITSKWDSRTINPND